VVAVLNDDLLGRVRHAAVRVAEAQERAEAERREYHRAVRRLHLAGASMREIAEALGVSHQRVHQMVEDAGGSPGWKPRKAGAAACSFCGVEQAEAGSLVSGPGVFICRSCVALSAEAITDAAAMTLPGGRVPAAVPLVCSFCDRPAGEAGRLVTGPGVRICERCVGFCADIVDVYLG
jgi:hypothetical protein